MKVKELIVQLLNEDMDDELVIETTGHVWVVADGIKTETGRNPGVVFLVPNMELKCA